MKPIKTEKTTGDYQAPKGWEGVVGELPYFREGGMVYSIWEFEHWERDFLLKNNGKILVGQMGEPIHPISLGVIGDGQTKKN